MASSEALSLDLFVLEALLERNSNSHGRTLYFSRMKMAVRALQRHLPLFNLDSLRDALGDYAKKRQEWTRSSPDPLSKVNDELKSVKTLLEKGAFEVLSRIDHAAELLFLETSRGFFLPLCIVALGCLGRIRILVIRKTRECLIELQSLVSEYKHMQEIDTLLEPTFVETILELLVEPPTNQARQTNFDAERILQSLGLIRGAKKRKDRNAGSDDAVESMAHDAEDQVYDAAEFDESSLKVAPKESADNANDHDIGESVTRPDVTFESEGVMKEEAPLNTHAQRDVADTNFVFLQNTDDRKRKNHTSDKEKKKRRKKSLKKRKKKDVFDEIFGDA